MRHRFCRHLKFNGSKRGGKTTALYFLNQHPQQYLNKLVKTIHLFIKTIHKLQQRIQPINL